MSVSTAMQFIQTLDRNLVLQTRLRRLRTPGDLAEVVAIARDAGFEISVDDLRAAFRRDWKMRRRFYGGTTPPPV